MSLDNLPTVFKCCYCCYLKPGVVMIAIWSFLIGLLFAPNVSFVRSFCSISYDSDLIFYGTIVENVMRAALGFVSIMLCVVSVMLLVGALGDMPPLIRYYQWGALVYCVFTSIIYFSLAMVCFLVHVSIVSGCILLIMMCLTILSTVYFLIVTQSLFERQKVFLNRNPYI